MNSTSSLINLGRLTKSQRMGEFLFCFLLFGSIEIFWRNSNSEFWDIIGIFFLFFGSTILLLRTNLGAKVLDRLHQVKLDLQSFLESIEIGLDFRPQTKTLSRFTRLEQGILILLGLFGVVFFYRISLPLLLANYLLKISAIAYLVVLGVVWGITLTFLIVIVFTAVSTFWENISSYYPKMNRYLILLVLLTFTLALILTLNSVLSPTFSIGLVILFSFVPFFLFHGHEAERPYLLYGVKGRTPTRSIALIQWGKSYLVFSTLFVAFWGTILIGNISDKNLTIRFPKTQLLGELFLWLWCIQRYYLLYYLYQWKQQSLFPASPKVLWIEKNSEFSIPQKVSHLLKKNNWKVLYKNRLPKKDEADLKLGFQCNPESETCSVPSLNTSAEKLQSDSAIWFIDRKDRLQKKRKFFRGMKKLFKIGSARENKPGDGYIMGPWWWLTQGLRRNEEEFSFNNYFNTFVGPHFQILFSKRLRQYIYDLFRSVDIDFVYLEDGISYNGFKKVMDIILEHYEMQGPGRPIEERHFLHLNGIKVIIDEFGAEDKKFAQRDPVKSYPEPEFSGISKARIMQIFKDRGDNDEDEGPPEVSCEDDYEWLRDSLGKMFPKVTPTGMRS